MATARGAPELDVDSLLPLLRENLAARVSLRDCWFGFSHRQSLVTVDGLETALRERGFKLQTRTCFDLIERFGDEKGVLRFAGFIRMVTTTEE